MQRQQFCIYLTYTTKDNLNTASGHVHGSWSDSAHSAETPINSSRKLSGSILIACLMRKVCHALWKIPGKSYRFLKSHFHSLPFGLSAARSLVPLLRNGWRERRQCKCELARINACFAVARRSACRNHASAREVQTKAQRQGTPGQLY